jgi:hypothetical protein
LDLAPAPVAPPSPPPAAVETGELPPDADASERSRGLADLSRPELYRLARRRGLRHTVVMTRAELIDALSRLED